MNTAALIDERDGAVQLHRNGVNDLHKPAEFLHKPADVSCGYAHSGGFRLTFRVRDRFKGW